MWLLNWMSSTWWLDVFVVVTFVVNVDCPLMC